MSPFGRHHRASIARAMMKSPKVESFLQQKLIKSLESRTERIGILCIDESGDLASTEDLETISGEDSARSVKSIGDIGESCKKNKQIWWHTHPTTLSSLSAEDRLSAGNLKSWLGDNIMCAAGIEGFSCHDLKTRIPSVLTKRWGPSYFETIKNSPISDVIFHSNKKWMLKKTKESSMSHVLCATQDGLVKCSGIDWDTGFNHFPVGVFTDIVVTGNVNVTPSSSGFDLLASPVDKKLDCVAVNAGTDGKTKILYCR